jgi:very-short-patch-repair endonuclease
MIYKGGPKPLTAQEIIDRAVSVHKNKYDYSEVVYENSYTKVKIKCSECGIAFWQCMHSHLRGEGCPECAKKLVINFNHRRRKTTEEFINNATSKYGDKYDYSKTKYINNITKVEIKCNKCGLVFLQKPSTHLRGRGGCPVCYGSILSNTEEFIKKSRVIHGVKYDYSKVKYVNCYTKVMIICPIHGEFEQTPNKHLRNHGCWKCYESYGERKISLWLDKNNIKYVRQKRFADCFVKKEKYNHRLPFDFYLPNLNLCIEYDGEQHFHPVRFKDYSEMVAKEKLDSLKIRDKIRDKFCYDNKIRLLRIPYTSFDNIDNVLQKELLK